MTELEEFLKALQKDPNLPSKLKKREELESFKEKYNVERATPLKCLACAAILQSPGSLYIDKDDPTRFVCRKCKLVYTLICHTLSIEALIANLRSIVKGDEKATLDWTKRRGGNNESGSNEKGNV